MPRIAYARCVRTVGVHSSRALWVIALTVGWLSGASATAALASASGISSAPARSAASLPPAPAPPELAALEQKMAQIHFNTEHFRLAAEISLNAGAFAGLIGGSNSGSLSSEATQIGASSQVRAVASDIPPIQEGAKITFSAGGEGVASISPVAGEFEIKEGKPITWERLVGGKLYQYQPSNPTHHPHRRWVSREEPASYQLLGSSSHFAEGALPGTGGGFAGLIALLGKAQRFESSGPATLAGQPVTGFTAILSPADLLSGGNVEKELKELTKSGVTTASLEVLITPAGLPLRVRLVLGGAISSVAIAGEILGLEVPVTVTPPPPRQTITAARLRRIESRHACVIFHVSKHKTRRICSQPQTTSESEPLSGLGF
jgi:hypothetical protein